MLASFANENKTLFLGRATEGSRTLDLTITNRLLYQLSHGGGYSVIRTASRFQVAAGL